MLHIILIILKIIGVLLLVILGLLLLTVLCLLFVPVCYRLEGIRNPDELSGNIRVSWLGGLLSVRAGITDGNTSLVIRIFGISMDRLKKIFSGIKRFFRRKPKRTVSSKTAVNTPVPMEKTEPLKTENSGMHDQREDRSPDKTADIHREEKQERPGSRIISKVRQIWLRMLGIPAKIRSVFRKFKLTITEIYAKIKKWKSFLADETTKEAIRFLWTTSKSLLRHLIPRRAKGYIKFGFDDPALTGQALGVCGLIVPLYKTKLQVIPVFDQEILEGRIVLGGHILGVVLLRLGWRVYRSKSVKKTIRRFQHKEA
ncbi:DUF2953 domain-containing protein [Ruminococcus gauvreauii]|uniref:DUF2953 domain-containing protein n=1 Tax=Ruminococcus gauvreauii TaxID=438033 RepID=A0ABY5VHB6_9FIRM|nr:DUF2953 domain-containing protein [Ruminococcus gauvreauii]UWP59677.1 DUF2953 domain-containing protein [Ruminococcus gauvreauii]